MRAALLFGREDLRVLEVADPVAAPGEVVVRIEAATTCGTDVKMWRRGHPILPAYPTRFGHEMAGVRDDTGERVLVGDSVACGACRACAAATCSSPLHPAPTTRRLSPGRRPALSCARSAHASGSVSVATTGSSPSSGSSSSTSSGPIRTRSANPPGSRAVAR